MMSSPGIQLPVIAVSIPVAALGPRGWLSPLLLLRCRHQGTHRIADCFAHLGHRRGGQICCILYACAPRPQFGSGLTVSVRHRASLCM